MTHGFVGSGRVLITGASGFVGSGVLRYMLEHTEFDFTCLCSWRHHGSPLRVPKDRRVKVVTHDLTAPIPDIGGFEYILHLAAESHVDRSIAEPVAFVENNVASTLQVLQYARKYAEPLQAMVLFSTDEVFGDYSGERLAPSNPYAASKAACEMLGQAWWRTYDVPVVLTRSNNIVGPGQDAEKYVPKLVQAISRGLLVRVHVTDHGPGVRFYNPLENVADGLMAILGVPPARFDPEWHYRLDEYDLGGGEARDNLAMAQAVAEILGRPLRYELVDAKSVRPGYDESYRRADDDLAPPGWKPVISLDESLRRWIGAA